MVQASQTFSIHSPILASLAIKVACLLCGGAVQAQSTDLNPEMPGAAELYSRYIENNGGRANIYAMTSLIIDGKIISSSGISREFKLVRKRPNLSRMRTDFEETTFNGKQAWRIELLRSGGQKVTQLEGKALDMLAQNSGMEGPFFQLAGLYDGMRAVAFEEVLGQPAVRVEIDPSNGSIYHTIWLSLEHFQEVRLSRTIPSEGAESAHEEDIYISDFAMIDAVRFGKKTEYYIDGTYNKTVLIERIRSNVGIFNSYFEVY